MQYRTFAAALLMMIALSASFAVAQEAPTEADLIATLQGDAGWEAKAEACRALRQVGTAAAAPALGGLLGDERLSHYARFALENITAPEAAAALRDALSTAPPALQPAIIHSLGARRDADAVSVLEPLLASEDALIAEAAAASLGRIATKESGRALSAALDGAPAERLVYLGEGIIAAAQGMVNEGNSDEAHKLLLALDAAELPEHIRMGTFEWLVRSRPKTAHTLLLDALAGDNPKQRDFAAALVASVTESPVRRYASALSSLPPGGQIALMRGLGLRGDADAEAALLEALESETPEVRAAAMQALGELDTPGSVPALAAFLTPSDTPEAAAAYEALRVSRVDGMDAVLAAGINEADAERSAQLIKLLTDRMAPEAIAAALAGLSESSGAAVRDASWRALAQLGGPEQFDAALAALPGVSSQDEQAAAIRALGAITTHNKEAVTAPLLAALPQATPKDYPALLRSLERLASPAALEAVLTALSHPDASVQDEAARSLGDWPTADALPHLAELAASPDEKRHERGLRGYVRLARAEADQTRKAELLQAVMSLARSKQDTWALLAAYGSVIAPQAFDTLLPYLDNEEVQNEAAAAIISVASELGKQEEHRAASIKALDTLLTKVKPGGVQDRAKAARDALGA